MPTKTLAKEPLIDDPKIIPTQITNLNLIHSPSNTLSTCILNIRQTKTGPFTFIMNPPIFFVQV